MSILYVFVGFEQTTGYKSGYKKSLYHSTCLCLEIVPPVLEWNGKFFSAKCQRENERSYITFTPELIHTPHTSRSFRKNRCYSPLTFHFEQEKELLLVNYGIQQQRQWKNQLQFVKRPSSTSTTPTIRYSYITATFDQRRSGIGWHGTVTILDAFIVITSACTTTGTHSTTTFHVVVVVESYERRHR